MKVTERLVVQPRKVLKLDEVHAALAGFALGDIGLGPPQSAGDSGLGEPGLSPGLPEPNQEFPIAG